MSISFISKISLYLSFILIFSCQNKISSLAKKDNIDIENYNVQFETEEFFDFSFIEEFENNAIDFYTNQSSVYNFFNKDESKLKINNYESKYNINAPINLIYFEDGIYSINIYGELLKFDIDSGNLLESYNLEIEQLNNVPVSFSLYKNDFIVAFKTGEVFRINKLGQVIWKFKNMDLLNTPIKIYNDNLIVLYPEKIILLDPSNANIVYEKVFESSNIIQSSGGKIENYYNIIFFILSNSEFNAIDTFLYEEHTLNFDNIELNTSLNNLNDQINIYKNFLTYLDNGNILHTYDLNDNKFILKNLRINNSSSAILINNALISKNENFISIYNIKNGNMFSKINIKKILNKNSIIINVLIINDKLHLFTNNGELIIFDQNLDFEGKVNLGIKKINKIYKYQNKIFISTEKGTTFII